MKWAIMKVWLAMAIGLTVGVLLMTVGETQALSYFSQDAVAASVKENLQITRFATGTYGRVDYRWLLNGHPFFLGPWLDARKWSPTSTANWPACTSWE
jgi:hypothetical protein